MGVVLLTLYMGPIAVALYVLADKEPRPGEHEDFIKPMWKQTVGSTLHCVAGDATGVILAATVTGLLGLPIATPSTARNVKPSTRECCPSAMRAAGPSRAPTRIRKTATASLPRNPTAAAAQPP